MGTHFGCIEQKGTVVDGCYVLPEVEFMKAFDYLNSLVASRFPRVGWAYLEKLDGTRDKVRAAQKTMFDVADRVIAEKRKKMESDKDDGNGEGDSKGHKDMLDYCESLFCPRLDHEAGTFLTILCSYAHQEL